MVDAPLDPRQRTEDFLFYLLGHGKPRQKKKPNKIQSCTSEQTKISTNNKRKYFDKHSEFYLEELKTN